MDTFDPVPGSEKALRSLLAIDVDAHFGSFTQAYHQEVRVIVRQLLNATHQGEMDEADTLATAIFLQMYSYLKNLEPEEILKQHLWTKLYQFTVDRCFGLLLGKYETRMYNSVRRLLHKSKSEQSAAVIELAEEIFTSIRRNLSHCDQQAIRTSQFWLWLHNCIIAHCFELLFETYRPQLEAFVLGLGSNTHEAEDIVQQAFLNAFKHLKSHGVPSKGPFDPKGWIYAVAKYAFLKSVRRSNHARRDLSIDSLTEEHPVFEIVDECTVPPDEAVRIAEFRRQLAELVSQLREPYREIIRLRVFNDLSTKEIAARLSMKPVTVRSYIHRGIKALQKQKGLLE